jgi:transposase
MNQQKIQLRKSIITLHNKGKKQTEIAYLLDIPQTVVSYWIRRHNKTSSFEDKPRPGKPPKLTTEQLLEVKKELHGISPERYGGESVGWITKSAIDFVYDKYGVKYSMRRMQELFHKLGLNLITPRSEHYNASKLARNSFREEFKKNFKKNIWVSPSLISTKQHSD